MEMLLTNQLTNFRKKGLRHIHQSLKKTSVHCQKIKKISKKLKMYANISLFPRSI